MEQKESRNSREIILVIILIILIIGFSLLNILILKKISYQRKINEHDKNTVIKYKKDREEIKKNKSSIDKELAFYNNIDNELVNKKNEYFENIKKLEKLVQEGKSSHKIAYLTFDDGPYYLTNSVLNVLEQHDVLATFFTIGLDKDSCYDNRNASCKETYNTIVTKGHTIANHTYSHLIFRGLYSSADAFMNQVKIQEDLIRNRTGVTTKIVRFPGGSGTAKGLKESIIQKLRQNGYGWVDWTAFDGDGGYLVNRGVAMDNIRKSIDSNIEVVLLHDYNETTLAVLPEIITYLRDNNYILLPLFYDSVMINK